MMDGQIRRVGLVLVIAFLAVFAQLNYLQIFAAEDIAANPHNLRSLLREYSIKRGDITTLDGKRIAVSKETGGQFKYKRAYPDGELFGHVTGYYSLLYGNTRIEATYNDELLGDSGVLSMQDIEDRLLEGGEQGDNVRLTIDSELQRTAREALGSQHGAVIAMDPTTGEVRAMWSNPSYDPNGFAQFDRDAQQRYRRSLDPTSPTSPLIDKTTSQTYAPGSTFKVVTAAAALESGRYDPSDTFDDPVELDLPLTDETLQNFSKTSCLGGGPITLFDALRVSCDTTFAELGLEINDDIVDMAESLGFNTRIPFDVGTAESVYPDEPDDRAPFRAFSAIGQGDTRATPLQMALVAATVANGGEVPAPRLVREVFDPSGGIVERSDYESLGQAFSAQTASELTDMMAAVVTDGTGTAAQMTDVEVAGKTGTAQTVEGEAPHAWFICFAPTRSPRLAVAVLVENGGSLGSEATGGAVAAPIAKSLLEADRRIRNW